MIATIAEATWKKGQQCSEPGCEEKFNYRNEFIVHTSYHVYHQKIKDIGKQELESLEKRFNTEIRCPLADNLDGCYNFPQLPSRLICQWYECGMEFFDVELFYEHVSNHAHRLVDKCYWNECHKVLKTVSMQLWREHLRVHTLQKLYACPYCGNFFSTKIKFDDHFLRHLPLPDFLEDEDLEPNVISKTDGEFSYDIEEYDIDDKKVKIFRCTSTECYKAFLTSSLLREHIRIHSNKNQCDECSYVAKSSSRLVSHKLYRHQDERKHKCSFCSKTFKQRGDLRAHLRAHLISRERFKCDFENCDYETLREEGLRAHRKIHDSNQDYYCHLCERVFNRGNNLSRHLKDKHKFILPDGQSRFKYRLVDEGERKYFVLCSEINSVNTGQQMEIQTPSPAIELNVPTTFS